MEQQSNLFDLHIDPSTETFLRETARWGKFLSIVGFVSCGIMVLVAVFARVIFTILSGRAMVGDVFGTVPTLVITVIYLLAALIWFLPCLSLFNFSTKMKRALAARDQASLHTSLKNLKSCFRFVGVMTLIVLGFYGLVFLLGIISTTFR